MAPMKMNEPAMSSWRIFSLKVAGTGFACFGAVKKMRMMAALRPPTGRLTEESLVDVFRMVDGMNSTHCKSTNAMIRSR